MAVKHHEGKMEYWDSSAVEPLGIPHLFRAFALPYRHCQSQSEANSAFYPSWDGK